ncbi:hypothetical protein [Methylobacterium radiotolerans]|uniref:hypothetical protein n=1 Tax=Methylobacterium radiotolerans TaxID=31998 RepID=UPI0038CFA06C
MKKPIATRPVFDPANRTLDFSGTPNFELRRLFGVANARTGQLIYSPIVPDLVASNVAGSVVTLSFNTNGMVPADPLVIQYDDGINDLPPDAARESKQDTGITRLTEIRDAVKAQRSETIWTDDTGARFIRVDSGGTITWTDVAGNAGSPPGAGARPDYDSGLVISRSTWRATADGTGFSSGDYLDHFVVTDGDAGDPISNYWFNVTTGAKLAAPPSTASISPYSPLPDGASTAARQDTTNTALATIATGIGAPGDDDPGSDAADGSVIARLARLLASVTGLATLLTAIRDRLPSALTAAGGLQVDGSSVTQPISAAALPLPDGAATESKLEAVRALVAGSTITADNGGAPIAAGANVVAAAANPTRQFIEITNTGPNPMAYRWGAAATAAVGHILAPGQSVRYDRKVPTAALNVFSTSGTTCFVTSG